MARYITFQSVGRIGGERETEGENDRGLLPGARSQEVQRFRRDISGGTPGGLEGDSGRVFERRADARYE